MPFTEAEGSGSFHSSYLNFSHLYLEIIQFIILCQADPCFLRKQ